MRALVLLSVSAVLQAMPVAEQNAVVCQYCAVCHTDAANNGGLSLEHYDAATAPASLQAMLLSKITGGLSLDTLRAPQHAALLRQRIDGGAMRAAGLALPPHAEPFVNALIAAASGATAAWTVRHGEASLLREHPRATATDARAYRLTVSCGSGAMQLAWSPEPKRGTLAISVDGRPAQRFIVDGSEKMGNGSKTVTQGLAAFTLAGIARPLRSLTASELFPGETVTFPFDTLPRCQQ